MTSTITQDWMPLLLCVFAFSQWLTRNGRGAAYPFNFFA
jgi:hypothetical protein